MNYASHYKGRRIALELFLFALTVGLAFAPRGWDFLLWLVGFVWGLLAGKEMGRNYERKLRGEKVEEYRWP